LENIENKIDKEIDSSKLRSHVSHGKRRKTTSVDRNHLHSPKHSLRKENISSNPSHVINHKRRTGIEKLQREMNKINPPTFDSEHKKDGYVDTWLLGMRKYF
jgi:hypothetical protein